MVGAFGQKQSARARGQPGEDDALPPGLQRRVDGLHRGVALRRDVLRVVAPVRRQLAPVLAVRVPDREPRERVQRQRRARDARRQVGVAARPQGRQGWGPRRGDATRRGEWRGCPRGRDVVSEVVGCDRVAALLTSVMCAGVVV